jgi:hypothetical protein
MVTTNCSHRMRARHVALRAASPAPELTPGEPGEAAEEAETDYQDVAVGWLPTGRLEAFPS